MAVERPSSPCSSPRRSATRASSPSRRSSGPRSSPSRQHPSPHEQPRPPPQERHAQGQDRPRGRPRRHPRGVLPALQDGHRAVATRRCSPASSPAETGKITKALDEQGIAYEIQNGGTAIGVQTADAARARIALAESGLPGQGPARLRAVRQAEARHQRLPAAGQLPARARGRDRQHDRARSRASPAPRSSSSCPRTQLFAEDAKPATAAVLLSGDAAALEPSAVRGMAQLVSSSRRGPRARQGHDHRRQRLAAVAEGGRRRRRRR